MVMQKLNTGTTSKALRWFLGFFLFAAVAGLVLTDMGGFFRDGGGASSVARVGRKDIDVVTFSRAYDRALQQSGLQDAAARQMGVPFMVLQQEVTRETLRQAAEKSGLRVSRAYVAGFLARELESLPGPGTPDEKLRMVLQKQGLNESTLVRLLREDSAIDTLVNATATGAASLPDALAVAPWRAAREKRAADLIEITPAALKDFKKPDEKDVAAYYNEHKEEYRLPEKRRGEALVIPQDRLLRDVSVSDHEIETYYNEHKSQFMTPARARLEQIIVQDKRRAEEIADAKPGTLEKFKGENADHIPMGWNSQTTLPKEIAAALYPERKTGLIGPVQTALGWHVLIVEKHEDGKPRPFAEVKPVLARQLKDEKLDREISGVSDRIDQMVAEGRTLRQIGGEFRANPVTIPAVTATDAADKLKATGISEAALPRILEAFFTLGEDEVSPVQQMTNGDIVLVRVENIEDSTIPPLSAIQSDVAAAALKDRKIRVMGRLAEEMIGAFDAENPAAFDEALKKAGLARKPVAADTLENLDKRLDSRTAQILFSLSKKNPISFSNDEDKVTLVVLKSIQAEKGTPDAKTLAELQRAAQQSFGHEIQTQFVQSWQNRLRVSINQSVMQRLFAPKEKE